MMVQQDLNQVMEILMVIVDEQLMLDMVVDGQLVLDMLADEQLIVDGTEMDCSEVDCCRMEVSCVRSAKVLSFVKAGVVGVAGMSTVPN
ncbi:hypothetical protein Tco_1117029 [Tanacetum coccineum]